MNSNSALINRLPWLDWLVVAAGTILLNLIIFGSASLLQREIAGDNSLAIQSIQAFMPEDIPPLPEKKPEPPPKKAPPKMKLRLLKAGAPPKQRPDLQTPALDLEINTKLAAGLDLGPVIQSKPQVGAVDHGPIITGRTPPLYPYHAKRRGVEGVVSVRFLVNKKGRVSQLSIVKAIPPKIFENAVRRSVVRWRFRPGTNQGRPVETWVETDIVFKMEN